MKCANCNEDALYIYQITLSSQIFYCNTHLPSFLLKAKKAGLLQTTDALKTVLEEGLKNIATPMPKPVVVEEEPVIEEAPTPKPKKKVAKKKAE